MTTSKYILLYKKNKTLNSKNSLTRLGGLILIELYKNKLSWPLELLSLYLDDSLGCRQWVDSIELLFLTQNLLEWIKHLNLTSNNNKIKKKKSNQEEKEEEDEENSSGEEEILDTSSNSMNNGMLFDIYDRFQGRHDDALKIVFHTLAQRCGLKIDKISETSSTEYTQIIQELNPSTNSLMNASSVLITTMQSFCSLPPIRFLATKCISIWISNPALIEYVGRLLLQIGQSLQSYTSGIIIYT